MKIHLFYSCGQVFVFALGHWQGCECTRNAEVVWEKEEGLDGLVNELLSSSGCVV